MNIINKLKENRYAVSISIIIILLLVSCIFLVLNSNKQDNIDDSSDNTNNIIKSDNKIPYLDGLVENVNNGDIEIISNKNNEQSDIILESIGIDITQLSTYAASIDPLIDSTYAIAILKPKEGFIESMEYELHDYIASKQRYFDTTGDMGKYKIARDAAVYNNGEYLVLAMCNDCVAVADKLIEGLDKMDLGEINE